MRALLRSLAVMALALPLLSLPAIGRAQTAGATPQGLWITANHDAVIQIAPCGPDLCGFIVGMFLGPHDPTPKDWVGDSQCRLTIIQAAPRTGADGQEYWAGHVTDPRDGSSYNADIRLNAANQLSLLGYIGLPVFGQTQVWTAYHGQLAENCRLTQGQG